MEIWLLVQTGTANNGPVFALAYGFSFSSTEEAKAHADRAGFAKFIFATTLKEE